MAAVTLVEVGAATWEAASVVGAADSMVAVATAEVLVATTVDIAAERTGAAIAAARIREGMQAEVDTVAHTQREAPVLPDRGRGKVKARGTLLQAGTDSREIMAR